MSCRPAGQPIRSSPQGLTWRGNTGESSRQGGLGPPPATTISTPPGLGHRHKETAKEGPILLKRSDGYPGRECEEDTLSGTRSSHRAPEEAADRTLSAGPPTVPRRSLTLYIKPGRGRDGYSAKGTLYHGPARDEDARAPPR